MWWRRKRRKRARATYNFPIGCTMNVVALTRVNLRKISRHSQRTLLGEGTGPAVLGVGEGRNASYKSISMCFARMASGSDSCISGAFLSPGFLMYQKTGNEGGNARTSRNSFGVIRQVESRELAAYNDKQKGTTQTAITGIKPNKFEFFMRVFI